MEIDTKHPGWLFGLVNLSHDDLYLVFSAEDYDISSSRIQRKEIGHKIPGWSSVIQCQQTSCSEVETLSHSNSYLSLTAR